MRESIKKIILANSDKDVIYFLLGGCTYAADPDALKNTLDLQENIAAVRTNGLVFSFDPQFKEDLTCAFGVNSALYRRSSEAPEEELLSIFGDEKTYTELFKNKKVIIIDGISTKSILDITFKIVMLNSEKPNFHAFTWVAGAKFHHLNSRSVYFPQDPTRSKSGYPLYNIFTNCGGHLKIADIATWENLSFISKIYGSEPLSTETITEVATNYANKVTQNAKYASHQLFSPRVDSDIKADTGAVDEPAIQPKKS